MQGPVGHTHHHGKTTGHGVVSLWASRMGLLGCFLTD